MNGVCVIGAGSSGIAACQALQARGIAFDCFEIGSAVGGNWRYDNDNRLSSAYRSLHAKSSKLGMQYASFPMPDEYPNYLSHSLITRYLDDFVDHYGFRNRIQFGTEVIGVEPTGDGRRDGHWEVTVRRGGTGVTATARYGAVLVATGHHWDPRFPEPDFPGADGFTGVQMHSHSYRTPEQFARKRVVCLASATQRATSRPTARRSQAFDGDMVCFADGTAERADVVIYCTGYKISFPFLDRALLGDRLGIDGERGEVPLYLRVVPPALPGLFFIGLVQPIGAIMPAAELQSRWVADLLDGRASLPTQSAMRREVAKYRELIVRRYGPAARHAISVDFLPYCKELARERRAGARRAASAEKDRTALSIRRSAARRSWWKSQWRPSEAGTVLRPISSIIDGRSS